MSITKDEARAIAQGFHDASRELGRYRFENWDSLTTSQRKAIEDAEWDLLNLSSMLITAAVGITLKDMETDLDELSGAAAKATKAIKKIEAVKDLLEVAAAVVVLGGAILSRDPNAIANTAQDLLQTAKAAIERANA